MDEGDTLTLSFLKTHFCFANQGKIFFFIPTSALEIDPKIERDENVRPNGRRQRRRSTPNVDHPHPDVLLLIDVDQLEKLSGGRRPVE